MAEPFLSEIRTMSFDFPPKGWALCNGQLLPINQNQALFSLLGTTFGGNGQTTFALPDLRGHAPIHAGGGHALGERGGEQSHTLSTAELPTHAHAAQATSNPGNTTNPSGGFLAVSTVSSYVTPQDLVPLAPASVAPVGGGQAHETMQPFLALTFCIALQGIFPSRD